MQPAGKWRQPSKDTAEEGMLALCMVEEKI